MFYIGFVESSPRALVFRMHICGCNVTAPGMLLAVVHPSDSYRRLSILRKLSTKGSYRFGEWVARISEWCSRMTRTAILDASSKVTLSASSSLVGILRVVYLNRGLSINQDQSVMYGALGNRRP